MGWEKEEVEVTRWINDKGFLRDAVRKHGWAWEFVPDAFKGDPDILLAAVKSAPMILRYKAWEPYRDVMK